MSWLLVKLALIGNNWIPSHGQPVIIIPFLFCVFQRCLKMWVNFMYRYAIDADVPWNIFNLIIVLALPLWIKYTVLLPAIIVVFNINNFPFPLILF